MDRPVKLRLPGGGRYWSGRSRNLSAGGALIDVDHPARLQVGEVVQVAIPHHDREAVISSDRLFEARVVRNLGHGGVQQLALCFGPAVAEIRMAG